MGRPFLETIVKWRELELISLGYTKFTSAGKATIKCWRWQYQKMMEYYGHDFLYNQNTFIVLREIIKDWSTNEVVTENLMGLSPDRCTLEGQQHETEAKVELQGILSHVPHPILPSPPPPTAFYLRYPHPFALPPEPPLD